MNPRDFYQMLAPSGPWYVTLGVISAALLASKVIWSYAVWPFLRALWAAIVAAPQIASGMHDLMVLLQSDVIGKLALCHREVELNGVLLAELDARLAVLEGVVKQRLEGLSTKEGEPQ